MRRHSQGEPLQKAKRHQTQWHGLGVATAVLLTATAVSLSTLFAASLFLGSGEDNSPPDPKSAAIVDQLSLTQANPTFIASASAILQDAGYVVDYFPGEQVTVDFYRGLAVRDYDLLVLRVHSGRIVEDASKTDDVILFTGEPYDIAKAERDQLAGRVGWARYNQDASPLFGIMPAFIDESMLGNFDDTLIVMMGCDGLRSQRMAQAFLDKGASAFVSWSRPVSADHTDAATERLLEHLLLEGLDTAVAAAQTAAEVGPDPFYGAELRLLIQ